MPDIELTGRFQLPPSLTAGTALRAPRQREERVILLREPRLALQRRAAVARALGPCCLDPSQAGSSHFAPPLPIELPVPAKTLGLLCVHQLVPERHARLPSAEVRSEPDAVYALPHADVASVVVLVVVPGNFDPAR